MEATEGRFIADEDVDGVSFPTSFWTELGEVDGRANAITFEAGILFRL